VAAGAAKLAGKQRLFPDAAQHEAERSAALLIRDRSRR
jgi:hypothetical protein